MRTWTCLRPGSASRANYEPPRSSNPRSRQRFCLMSLPTSRAAAAPRAHIRTAHGELGTQSIQAPTRA